MTPALAALSVDNIIGLVLAIALLGYLIFTLVFPEKL